MSISATDEVIAAPTPDDLAQTYPELTQTYPELTQTYPELAQTYPELTQTYPELTQTYPELTQTYPEPSRTWRQKVSRIPAWVAPLGVGAIAASACAYTLAVDPNSDKGILPQCYFLALTGMDCPGCGLTRAAYALMKGDPMRSLDHNILALIVFPVMLYAYLAWTANSLGLRVPQIKIRPWMSIAATVAIFGFWIVRNLPGPFTFLDSRA